MKTEKELQQKIEEFYLRFNFSESWRFLNCAKKNLRRNNGILIITLNPGWRANIDYGNQHKFSSELGCSFLVEQFKSPIREQFIKFLTKLHTEVHSEKSFDEFVNEILLGNFIPIRSGSFKKLTNKKESINLGKELWNQIIKKNIDSLKLLVVIDKVTMRVVLEIFSAIGLKEIEPPFTLPTGWTGYNAEIIRFKFSEKVITLLRLPHLSHFRIFGRSVAENEINEIVKESVKYYKANEKKVVNVQ